MAQPMLDYAAFFADAKQAVGELEQLRAQEKQLEGRKKQLEAALKNKQKLMMDMVNQTVKSRKAEVTKSYDEELAKTQETGKGQESGNKGADRGGYEKPQQRK